MLLACAAALAALASSGVPAQERASDRFSYLPKAPAGKVWKVVFRDEFDGAKLDTSRWETPEPYARRDGWWLPSGIALDGKGHLALRVFKEGERYIDGCARTRGKFEHAYGYYVARVRMPRQVGHWPAFWLYNNCVGNLGDGGRNGAEIDIFEKPWLTDKVNLALHWDGYGKEHQSQGKQVEAPGISSGWHSFALWWTPDEYVFSIDGAEVWRTDAGGVCREPLYVKLSDEIGDWAGDIKKAQLPDETLVDFVRVYDLVDR